MAKVLFIPGYTTRGVDVYDAHRAVVEAGRRVQGTVHYGLTFSVKKIGNHQVLPTFPEMVTQAEDAVSKYAPDIIVGHCVGASVAVRLMQKAGTTSPIQTILLCPPVSLMASAQLENPTFRVFRRSTGIPKAPFCSEDLKQALTCKRETVLEASKVFVDLYQKESLPLLSENLSFISCRNDTLCDPRATARLAGILGCAHQELDDNHSLKRAAAVEKIEGMIAAYAGQKTYLPQCPPKLSGPSRKTPRIFF